jgi:hypothetical protein
MDARHQALLYLADQIRHHGSRLVLLRLRMQELEHSCDKRLAHSQLHANLFVFFDHELLLHDKRTQPIEFACLIHQLFINTDRL